MSKSANGTGKPHAVCIPIPFQGHIKTVLKLAKLLHHQGFRITFVNTERNQRRLLEARGPASFQCFSNDFKFETIPDGLPTSDTDAAIDNWELCKSTMTNWLAPFCDLLHKLNHSPSSPPVTCIISDGFLPFTVQAAKQFQIPVALFFTFSACAFVGFQQVTVLKDRGVIPPKEESPLTNGYLDTVIDGVPGMKDVRLRDLHTTARSTDLNDPWFEFFREPLVAASDASAIILHTFDALEKEILNALFPLLPPVYSIGPLQLLLNRIEGDDLSSIGSNMWKEESGCLQWLDSRKPNSVIYVNFGSITTMTNQQLIEFGIGLAQSGHAFLWIIRPGMVSGDTSALPPEFVEEAGDKAYITSWCPQEEVLNHPSIGGFLTHSGWGSTIESISSGVPVLCWPFIGDQPTNCRYCCREWGIGMEIEGEVDRNKMAKLVRELMEGDKGKRLKKKVMEWKELAEEASGPDGSSTINLDRLVKEMLLSHQRLK